MSVLASERHLPRHASRHPARKNSARTHPYRFAQQVIYLSQLLRGVEFSFSSSGLQEGGLLPPVIGNSSAGKFNLSAGNSNFGADIGHFNEGSESSA